MKKIFILLITVATCVHALAGHLMLDGKYTSPGDGIYPGTERTFQVYVPEQYDGLQPACLYVGLDGVLRHAPQVMDSLISIGQMPVTIGVFLQPGIINDSHGQVIRYNRSNEFDATDDTFARFLETELLPAVGQMTTSDGRRIVLSRHGSDHMIFGLSSGGIAAFTAAWHRPDLFGRVFSGVGTFVAMRGGNDLQAIVRKSEPRPLRIFLQDGSNDAWNPLFGHWYEGNRMLATALEFAGYDCKFDWSDGGHNVHRATQIFAEVMKWMWHDWPAPITCGATRNDLLASLLVDGQDWKASTSSAIAVQRHDMVIYPDSAFAVKCHPGSNYLWQYRLENGNLTCGQRFYWLHSLDNALLHITAMTFDGNGNLWVVTDEGIQICDQNGRVRGIITLPCRPQDVNEISFGHQQVVITTRQGYTYHRSMNVTPPVPGKRPASQGQG